MRHLKSFNEFIFESQGGQNVVDAILVALETDIQQLLVRYEKSFVEQFGREMSKYDKELTRLNIIWDMVKSIEIYTQPTDTLIGVVSSTSSKGNLEINAVIKRDNVEYDYKTEAIYAGGHNIQVLHYRYITKTNLPMTGNSTIAKEYAERIKKMTKLEKLNKEITDLRHRINKNDDKIAKNSKVSDDEILDMIRTEDTTIDVTWDIIVSRGADKNYKDRADFEQKQKEYIDNKIDFWKTKNIKWAIEDTKNAEKQIQKLESKIEQMIPK
ncbi:hypothetical protein EBU94_01660 [bacterium]|nr:hypothetical protein [bacterium]